MKKSGIGTWVGFLLIMVWCLLPVAWIVSLSFKSLAETTTGSAQFLPKHPTWENYKVLLGMTADKSSSHDFLAALRNSFGISIISTFLAVLFRALDAFRIFDNIYVMTKGAQNTESSSFLTYRQSIEQFQLGMGSALSVLLFLTVLLLAYLIVKFFKVDLASARGEG
jgi:ABC-type sugar transport system permease subunit